MSTQDSAITIYQQPTLLAHIYKPGPNCTITKLRIKQCTINRGVSTITTAKLLCVLAYTTKLGGKVDNNYIVPNAADSDTLKGYYLMVCAPVTETVEGKDGKNTEKLHYVPVFVGIILGVSFSAHTGAANTSSQLTILCAAPLHKMMALKLGGGWYYARPLTATTASGILDSLVLGLRLARMGSLTISSTSVPSVIGNALATKLAAKYKDMGGMYTIFQIINLLYMLVATSIGNRLPEPSKDSSFDILDADKLSSMLDSSHQVRAVTPKSTLAAKPANGVDWAQIWYKLFLQQLMACLGSGDFGSILDMLIRDNFRMLDIVPVPLRLQQQAIYNKYDVKAALMRLVARSSILGPPKELKDISKLAVDNITYTADYKGLLQRPDQIVLCTRPISTAKQDSKEGSGSLNNDAGLYLIYPDFGSTDASKVMRRAQILTPDWLHWHYIHDIYGEQATKQYMSKYAQMLYALLYDTYGLLTLSGAVVDIKNIPFDDYLGKIIKLEKPDWTLPFLPADRLQKKGKVYYVGRVLQLILTYMSDAAGDGKSKLRYTATVRVVPSSVLPAGVRDGKLLSYIQNNLYTLYKNKPQ